MNNVGNTEILPIIEAVAREKGINRESLLSTMEQAVQTAARRKYGNEHDIRAEISRKNGEIKLYRVLEIVEIVHNHFTEISYEHAKQRQNDLKIGDQVHDPLPPIDLGRVAAQVAKQVIVQKVSEAEREKQYQDFKDRKGEILNGTVKRIEFGDIIVDLGRAEAFIKRDQLIRSENFKVNDRIKAYVQDVRLELKGPQIFLSRTDDMMLAKLLELEVPEIYDGIIKIKAIARDPGSKAKVAVYAADSSIDPVGSCVGIRGNRVRAVTNELGGEKIDIILWNNNAAQFAINAMAPAEITKIVIDEDRGRVEIVVPNDQLNIAIGKRGQNVRLASRITGWRIDVMTEEQESKRRTDEFNSTTQLFMEILDVEEVIGQLLSAEGFINIEQIANIDLDTLTAIDGFNEDLAVEIKNRANVYIEGKNNNIIEELEKLGVAQELIDILDLQPESILRLAEYGVKNIEDLGELSVGEFKKLVVNCPLSDSDISLLIQTARLQE